MQRHTFRFSSRFAVVAPVLAVVAALAVGTAIWQSRAADDGSGVVQTSWGPLTAADRDLLAKARLTCLWEVSTAQQAQQQASSGEVRDVARKIAVEHVGFDQKVRDVADRLGVPLPSSPDAQQVAWTKEISDATGPNYDRVVVQRLREADGNVMPVAMRVRVGTGNGLVRGFAGDTLDNVARHVSYLEGTGLVDYSALPQPPPPGLMSGSGNWRQLVAPGLLLLACLLAAVWLGRELRHRNRSSRIEKKSAESILAPLAADDRSPDALPEAEAGETREARAVNRQLSKPSRATRRR